MVLWLDLYNFTTGCHILKIAGINICNVEINLTVKYSFMCVAKEVNFTLMVQGNIRFS